MVKKTFVLYACMALMTGMSLGQQFSCEDPSVLSYEPPHPTEEMVKAVTYVHEMPTSTVVKLPNGVDLEMVGIGSGSFVMGNVVPRTGSGNVKNRININLGHRVKITKPYWIGRYEVTQRQFVAVVGKRDFPYAGDDFPACGVNWQEAKRFVDRLNEIARGDMPSGYKFDLPTEAQWEFACRALTTTEFNNGYDGEVTNKAFSVSGEGMVKLNYLHNSAVADEVAWYAANASNTVHAVGQKNPNEWGLYDMHGNVAEWCLDCYNYFDGTNYVDPYFGDYTHLPNNPILIERFAGDNAHAARGGSYADVMSENITSYGRLPIGADQEFPILGFRVALVPDVQMGLQIDANDVAAYGVCPFTVNMKLRQKELALKARASKETVVQIPESAEAARARAEAARARAEAAKRSLVTAPTPAVTTNRISDANSQDQLRVPNVSSRDATKSVAGFSTQPASNSFWKWLDMAMIGLDVAVKVIDSAVEIDNAIHRKNNRYRYADAGNPCMSGDLNAANGGEQNSDCGKAQVSSTWGTIYGPNTLGNGKSATYKLYVGGSLVNANWSQGGTSISVYGSGSYARVRAGDPPIKSGKFKTGIRAVYNGKTYQKYIYIMK